MAKKRILVVEDHILTREMLVKVLEERGFSVSAFASLRKAKEAGTDFDGFIVDGSLENPYDGFEWAKELLSKGLNVVVFSSDRPPGDIPFVDKKQSRPGKRLIEILGLES